MPQIPERTVTFNAYSGPKADLLIGPATAELPAIEMMTESISGPGIAGEIDSIVLGHTKSLAAKVNFRTVTAALLALLAPVRQTIVLMASIQTKDSMLGQLITQSWRIECTGMVKSSTTGKLEPGKVMDAALEVECERLQIDLNGVTQIEIDKLNMIFRIGTVDYLAGVRKDVGGL
jgi:uncharacterized protein